MPRLEEVEIYLRGIWMLLTGKPEGPLWLDLTERGFWRSWWAFAYCLPPMLLSWVAFRNIYLASAAEGNTAGLGFFFKLFTVDVAGWIVPAVALALVARLAGLGQYAIPVIIATNWLSVPLQWIYAIENSVQLMIPDSEAFTVLFDLALLTVSLILHFRLIGQLTGGNRLAPFAMLLTLFIVSLFVQYQLMTGYGLWVTS